MEAWGGCSHVIGPFVPDFAFDSVRVSPQKAFRRFATLLSRVGDRWGYQVFILDWASFIRYDFGGVLAMIFLGRN